MFPTAVQDKKSSGVYRGGNYNNASNAGFGYANGNNSPSNTNNNIGFRVASRAGKILICLECSLNIP